MTVWQLINRLEQVIQEAADIGVTDDDIINALTLVESVVFRHGMRRIKQEDNK